MAGYSKRSLREKLGLKPGFSSVFLYAPLTYIEELGEIDDIQVYSTARGEHDFIHLFVKDKSLLEKELPRLMQTIKPSGMIWVSWPKISSKVATDVTEDTIRGVCLPLGLVDVKVAAIDEIWSGLKLVIRVKNRI